MKAINLVIRIIVGLVFIISAIAKLYPIEPFEIIFVDLGVSNWLFAPFLSRFIISFELFLGLCIIFNQWFNQLIYYLAQLSLVVFSGYLIFILFSKGNNVDCGCFGNWLSLNPLQSLFKNVALFGGLFLIHKKDYAKGLKWVFPLLFLTTSFLTTFLINRVGLQNVQAISLNQPVNLSELPALYETGEKVDFSTGKKLIAFLSVGCNHCKSASYRLSYINNKIKPSNFYIVLASLEEKNIKPFFEETGLKEPFIWINDDSFFKYSGGKLPAFIYIENGILKKKWTGEFFKIEELEKLLVD